MPNYKDPQAVANRIRAATASLTDPRDWNVATEYIRELEALAWDKNSKTIVIIGTGVPDDK